MVGLGVGHHGDEVCIRQAQHMLGPSHGVQCQAKGDFSDVVVTAFGGEDVTYPIPEPVVYARAQLFVVKGASCEGLKHASLLVLFAVETRTMPGKDATRVHFPEFVDALVGKVLQQKVVAWRGSIDEVVGVHPTDQVERHKFERQIQEAEMPKQGVTAEEVKKARARKRFHHEGNNGDCGSDLGPFEPVAWTIAFGAG